jgi:hypothetical protein
MAHIQELKKNLIFTEYFSVAKTNANNTRDIFTNKERVDSSIEPKNEKRIRVPSQQNILFNNSRNINREIQNIRHNKI